MRTLRHPAFDDVTVDVPDEAAERWQLAGWLADIEPDATPAHSSPARRGSTTPSGPAHTPEGNTA